MSQQRKGSSGGAYGKGARPKQRNGCSASANSRDQADGDTSAGLPWMCAVCNDAVNEDTRSMWKTILLRSLGVSGVLLQYGCIAHCTLEFVANFVVCSGPSMLPTITPDDVVLTEHISVHRRTIQVGDVVIVRSPQKPSQHICKRVTALEGDQVHSTGWPYFSQYIPRGHVWLEGDNKDNSSDSRSYGPVPYALIRSRVFFKIWPPKKIGRLPDTWDEDAR